MEICLLYIFRAHIALRKYALNWYLLGFKSNIMLISYVLCSTSPQHVQLYRSSFRFFFIIHGFSTRKNLSRVLTFSSIIKVSTV